MYKINNSFTTENALPWNQILKTLKKGSAIFSITGVQYEITGTSETQISYRAPSRNSGKPETISKEDVVTFVRICKNKSRFTTASVKNEIPSPVYRKRSPLFAILLASGVAEPLNK